MEKRYHSKFYTIITFVGHIVSHTITIIESSEAGMVACSPLDTKRCFN